MDPEKERLALGTALGEIRWRAPKHDPCKSFTVETPGALGGGVGVSRVLVTQWRGVSVFKRTLYYLRICNNSKLIAHDTG